MIGERFRPSTQVRHWVNPNLVDLGGFIYWPRVLHVTAASLVFDAANEKLAYVFQAPKTGTIDRVGFLVSAFTTGATIDVRLETVDSAGDPSGSLVATDSNAAYVISSTGFKEVTLTAGAAVTKGAWIAVVLVNPAVSQAVVSIPRFDLGEIDSAAYYGNYTGSWSKGRDALAGVVRYSDGSYPAMSRIHPFAAPPATVAFSSSSTPDERGNKLTVPFACEVAGFWSAHSTDTDARTFRLYDAANNVLGSLAVSGALLSSTAAFHWLLPVPVALSAGQVVRLTTLPGAASMNLWESTFPAGMEAAMPGAGWAMLTTRADAGAWTDLSTSFAHMGLIISKVRAG